MYNDSGTEKDPLPQTINEQKKKHLGMKKTCIFCYISGVPKKKNVGVHGKTQVLSEESGAQLSGKVIAEIPEPSICKVTPPCSPDSTQRAKMKFSEVAKKMMRV